MKKLNTSLITTGVGYPPSKKGWDFLMQSYTETIADLVKGMFNGTYAANTPYVLYGCVKSNISSPFAYSAGAIFYNGEVYTFPAIASIAIATSDVCTITTTNDPTADPTTMSDGSVVNIHNIRAIVLSDAASVTNGATQFNYSSCVFLKEKKKYSQDYASGSSLIDWGTYSIYFWKTGNRVYIEGSVLYQVAIAPSPETELFVLPVGYRPSSVVYTIQASVSGGVASYRLSVSTGGSVSVVDDTDITTLNQQFYVYLSFEL